VILIGAGECPEPSSHQPEGQSSFIFLNRGARSRLADARVYLSPDMRWVESSEVVGAVPSADVDVESAGVECGDDAAVHEEVGAGDEGGVGSEEEGGDGGDFVGGADPSGC
jgi:hypothetical protein